MQGIDGTEAKGKILLKVSNDCQSEHKLLKSNYSKITRDLRKKNQQEI